MRTRSGTLGDRGVPTRRYAYCEKSIYQFMELVLTGQLTGRYQLMNEALGSRAKVNEARPDIVAMVAGGEADPGRTTLEPEQIAFLHQWMGSGQQQRGLSLTSTPRLNAVYSNDADPFKEEDGVRIKIDLAKVPRRVVLLNHYAAGGVKDTLAGVDPARYQQEPGDTSRKYAYKGSVQKNRELFLERLRPEWVSEVTFHRGENGAPTVITAEGSKSILDHPYVERLRDAYRTGFSRQAAPPGADAGMLEKGARSRGRYEKGYLAGVAEWAAYRSAFAVWQLEVWDTFTNVQALTLGPRQEKAQAAQAEGRRKQREARQQKREAQLQAELKEIGEKQQDAYEAEKRQQWEKEDKEVAAPAAVAPEKPWSDAKRLEEAKKLVKDRYADADMLPPAQRLAALWVCDAFDRAKVADVESLVTRAPPLDRWGLLEALAKPPKREPGAPAVKREPPIHWLGWAHGAAEAQHPATMDENLYQHRPLQPPRRPPTREELLEELAGSSTR